MLTGGGDSVSINDRYFKGNFEFRGFDNAGVGPRVVNFAADNPDTGNFLVNGIDGRGNSLGGNAFGLASAEVSFPVGIPNLLGSLFIEAGTVGLLDEDEQFNTIVTPGTSGLSALPLELAFFGKAPLVQSGLTLHNLLFNNRKTIVNHFNLLPERGSNNVTL